MKDPRRWLLVLALAAAVGMVFVARGPRVRAPHGPCLVHGECLRAERCYVEPAEDGFASFGVCTDPCADDAQCGSGARCLDVGSPGTHLTPVRAAREAPRERVCVPERRR